MGKCVGCNATSQTRACIPLVALKPLFAAAVTPHLGGLCCDCLARTATIGRILLQKILISSGSGPSPKPCPARTECPRVAATRLPFRPPPAVTLPRPHPPAPQPSPSNSPTFHRGNFHPWPSVPSETHYVAVQAAKCTKWVVMAPPASARVAAVPTVSGPTNLWAYYYKNCTQNQSSSVEVNITLTANGKPLSDYNVTGESMTGEWACTGDTCSQCGLVH